MCITGLPKLKGVPYRKLYPGDTHYADIRLFHAIPWRLRLVVNPILLRSRRRQYCRVRPVS